jgi:peptidoglycan/xylan/chitin deacetylase (PgdA/CDA1 family)
MKKIWHGYALLYTLFWGLACAAEPVPILVYHRLGAVVADSMTLKTSVFASQLEYLQANAYAVIPLRRLTEFLADEKLTLPARAVVITVDDGHRSVYTDMFPLLQRYRIPVTLFIYPSAISNAKYAMTWQQLRQMQDSGLVDIQSHTYWHPNFRKEKKRLPAEQYEKLVYMQLYKSKVVLEQKLGNPVDMLAWPYGIYDDALLDKARQLGYRVGFTLKARAAERSDNPMALPRYLMTRQSPDLKVLLAGMAPHINKLTP